MKKLVEHMTSQSQLANIACSAIFALFFLCFLPGTAHAQVTTTYTNSTDSATNGINDSATPCTTTGYFVRTFSVPTSYTVSDVDIGVLMAHTYRGDLLMWLTSPAGTRVQFFTGTGTFRDNFNVLLDDSAANPVTGHNVNDTATPTTSVPPYQRSFSPANALTSAFTGENSLGTWTLELCDRFGGDSGTFYQSDLFLTDTPPNADLSLTKTVSNATPANGTNVTYTLTVANSATSTNTATGVTVQDTLPLGLTYVSSSGTGTYNSATGVWTVGSVPVNGSSSISIVATVTATSGATVVNSAEISASSVMDLDSTPNNGSTNEDDDDTASLTVTGTRTAGTPPSISGICTAAGVTTNLLDWDSHSWTSGSSSETITLTGIGDIDFDVATDGSFIDPLQLNSSNTGGFGAGQLSLRQLVEYTNITEVTTTTVTLPTAVPGAQFVVLDVDFGANDFADKLTVTGTYNGATVTPTLTNGVANYVTGNIAIGDAGSGGTSADGNVWVTFSAPVDTIVITYGNHTTAPADPDGQGINIYDFTFCNPTASLSVSKISSVVSDGVSASNPKAIPGATAQYCITVSNSGSGTATAVSASDNLPGDVTFVTGSMRSGASCGTASDSEDDNATGADESDPFGMSFATGGTNGTGVVTGTAGSLGPGDNLAMVFDVTLD